MSDININIHTKGLDPESPDGGETMIRRRATAERVYLNHGGTQPLPDRSYSSARLDGLGLHALELAQPMSEQSAKM